jgi:hypothetical protein
MASVLRNIELTNSRSVNKGVPEWLLTLALGAGVAALDFLARAFTDTEVIEQVPPWAAPFIAMAIKDVAQYARRGIRDKVKIDSQV